MRLEKRYLRGKSKKRGWSGGVVGLVRGRMPLMLVGCVLLTLYTAWTSTVFFFTRGTAPLAVLFGSPPPRIGDYPDLLLARYEHRMDREPKGLWDSPQDQPWHQCTRPPPQYSEPPARSNGYLQIFLDGGLNQQRIGICNAVAVARILNATLLIPEFQINAVWLDSSKFGDIFDEDFFIETLKNDVRIVRKLPKKLQWSTREHYATGVHGNRIKLTPMHASAEWYLTNVLPKLKKYRIVAIAPFTHRLAFDGLPADIQKLRCRVNYHALRFVPEIEELGQKLVARLRDPTRRHVARGILYEQGKGAADMVQYGKEHQQSERGGEPQLNFANSSTASYAMQTKTHRALLQSAVAETEEAQDGETGGGSLDDAEESELASPAEGQAQAKRSLLPPPSPLWSAVGRRAGLLKQKKYIALHLRFDMDMVAHSACDYGETDLEKEALAKYREYAWLGRVEKLRYSSEQLRREGKCPLTPEEAGLFLAALGFPPTTPLYIATYQVYGGTERLAPLRQLFPMLEDKTSLCTPEELKPLLGKASHLAALDFYVAFHSDVFVSASAGNMHNVMIGHRTFWGGSKTVNVNMTLMAELLLPYSQRKSQSSPSSEGEAEPEPAQLGDRTARNRAWAELSNLVQRGHKSRMGKIKLRRPDQSIYTYPAPDCLCPGE